MDLLLRRDYPGNIRELAQIVENAVLLAESSVIMPHHLGVTSPQPSLFARRLNSLKDNYETHIVYVLTHTRGNRRQAAEILGITVRQLQRQLARMKETPRWEGMIQ